MLPVCTKGWQLAESAFSGERKSYRRKQQYKIFLYTLMNPVFSKKWFNTLYSPEYNKVFTLRPRLYVKPFRVYMSARWNKHQRMKVILDTYNFINDLGIPLTQVLPEKKDITVGSFTLKDGQTASVVLGYDERYRKEGELVLFFVCEQLGGIISAASFSFELNNSKQWVCRIGCVQGHKTVDENTAKTAQKQMHGLRPKSFMVFLVQEFARSLGVVAIYGAGQTIQAFNRKHFIHIPILHKITQDYNNLWLELDGELKEDGWFELPLIFKRKAFEEIKSHKRALYKRRYEMMDNIASEITESIKKWYNTPNKII
ncbi:MAG: DUF535 family protein [Bacteroidetes bacterium]|nr:DUF535 family protein [Bacteroidota bacterium]